MLPHRGDAGFDLWLAWASCWEECVFLFLAVTNGILNRCDASKSLDSGTRDYYCEKNMPWEATCPNKMKETLTLDQTYKLEPSPVLMNLVGWIASLMQWIWIWTNFRRWWGTGEPGMLQSMGLWRVRHDLAIEQHLWAYSRPAQLQVTGRCLSQKWMLVLHPWVFGWVLHSFKVWFSWTDPALPKMPLRHVIPC